MGQCLIYAQIFNQNITRFLKELTSNNQAHFTPVFFSCTSTDDLVPPLSEYPLQ